MKNYRPLYIQDLDLSLPGAKLLRLQVNRHLRELDLIGPHEHGFSQCLFYLGGRGVQVIGGESHPVRSGTVVFLPPGTQHAFRETHPMRPLCLALDLEMEAMPAAARVAQLTQVDLAEARSMLSQLMRYRDTGQQLSRLRPAGLVLVLLDLLLKGLGVGGGNSRALPSPIVRAVTRVIQDPASRGLPLSKLALKVGYQRDHLNRMLREATGMTLGQLRAQQQAEQAKRMLAQRLPVGDVAERLGFSEQNYFARWFRKQTGTAPSKWRKQPK